MTFLELLVKELPSRGGWPEGAVECEHFVDEANIDFYDKDGNWDEDCSEKYGGNFAQSCVREIYSSGEKETVTREQYEQALKQTVWNGEGFPPVGTECEAYKHSPEGGKVWVRVKIMYMSEFTAVMQELEVGSTGEQIHHPRIMEFRPTRTEAERKRDEIIEAIYKSNGIRARDGGKQAAIDIYDAIAAGKIPHVTLS